MLTKRTFALAAIFGAAFWGCQQSGGNLDDAERWATDFVANFQQIMPQVPLLQSQKSNMLDEKEAYAVQQQVIDKFRASGEKMIGYKLGLTGKVRPFGAPEPVYGQLWSSMQLAQSDTVRLSHFVQAMVEVELAFYFADDVDYPVAPEQLRKAVAAVAPAIELPDLAFSSMENLSYLDLIAANVGARHLIVGEKQPISNVDINALQVRIAHNGALAGQGSASAVMGDQWSALAFLAEKLHARDKKIKAGEVVLTGTMTAMSPAKVGRYDADFGELGSLYFWCKP